MDTVVAEPPDIFEHLEKFNQPQHIYIVGAGKNGAEFYKHIPKDAFTMAANGALAAGNNPEFYPYPWNVWAAFDLGVRDAPYYRMKIPDETVIVMGPALGSRTVKAGRRCDYHFPHAGTIRRGKLPLVFGSAFGGATIVGCMLAIGWFMGAAKFTFVGVDMKGDRHWDGTKAARGTGNWPQLTKLQHLVTTIRKRGGVLNSLSETALNVPVVMPGKE
jgi:hypothetical protein